MFIFINGILVVDLGGVHQRLPGRVDVTARPAWRRSPKAARWTRPARPSCRARAADPYTGVTVQPHDRQRRQRSHELHDRHLRLPHPHGRPRAADGPDLRDRGVRRRSPPDRVELPAHAVRVPDAEVELRAPLRRRRRRRAPRSATAATHRPRRRIRSAPGRPTTAPTAVARPRASTVRIAATARPTRPTARSATSAAA